MSASSRIAPFVARAERELRQIASFTPACSARTADTMLLDFLMPAYCAACGRPGSGLCDRCSALIASSSAILIGGRDGTPPLTALGAYEGVLRTAILALKFRNARHVGTRLGNWLGRRLIWPFEVVIPVPLHAARLRMRGFNQAGVIARAVARAAGSCFVEHALVRNRSTLPQSSLDLAGRQANVRGAFAPGRHVDRVAGCRVLIVDDVVTTGATLRACAAALIASGVRTVYGAAAAVRL